MSEAGGGRGFLAPPAPEPPPFSQTTPSWLLRLLMDLEERARGRRSKSTLLLRESILEACIKNFKKEGVGGRKMKTNDRKVRERAEKRVKRAEREMKTERVGRKIICHLRQRIKASRRESYQATRRETALLKCWHSAVCESVRMCALSGAGRKLGPFFRIEGVFMSNSSDLAPSAFSANKRTITPASILGLRVSGVQTCRSGASDQL